MSPRVNAQIHKELRGSALFRIDVGNERVNHKIAIKQNVRTEADDRRRGCSRTHARTMVRHSLGGGFRGQALLGEVSV